MEQYDVLHYVKESNVLGMSPDDGMGRRSSIGGLGDQSFVVNNVYISQPIIVLPNSFLMWEKVSNVADISIESLKVLTMLHPIPEILFLGIGENVDLPARTMTTDGELPFPHNIKEYFREKGVIVEVMTTRNAATTFNVLNTDGRHVVAALLTEKPYVAISDSD
jgi:NADH dehydrogenase [ubiquinone] 1 alpha subcomplex assembly factor 3